ncbi:MAG: hypothetical protein CME61_01240 [Halobacteriovoraceae bacterium]|nr:hypothetical protein [Halobacteriovoraceae bacterium]|tara:strand:- start:986 stop:1327 length:342 start_codon:yes stop_codon:yes gene_type:complete
MKFLLFLSLIITNHASAYEKKCLPPLKADQVICSKSKTTPEVIICGGINYKALNDADAIESFLQNNKGPQVNNDNNNNMGVEYEPRDSRNPSVPSEPSDSSNQEEAGSEAIGY